MSKVMSEQNTLSPDLTPVCFGTIKSVLKHDGVVEGGTGEMKKEAEEKQKEVVGK